jgi:hypothetical protein
MKTAVKNAERHIIVAGYGIYTTVRKDLRGNPAEKAMLGYAWRPDRLRKTRHF